MSGNCRINSFSFDFGCVVLGWLPFISVYIKGAEQNLSTIRVARILKALKSLNKIEGLKIMASSLINSGPSIMNSMMLLLYCMILFCKCCIESNKLNQQSLEFSYFPAAFINSATVMTLLTFLSTIRYLE